jgi:mono/diheme cytochrome c family protein
VRANQPKKKNRLVGIVILLVVLAFFVLTAINAARNWTATEAAKSLKNPIPSSADALTAGKQIYADHCRSCHGEKGDGKGERAAELSVEPGDFTDVAQMRRRTDGELFWQITRGRLPMPAFADKLSDEQRWQLVDYIRTFAQNSADAVRRGPLTSLSQAPQKLP